MRLFFGFDLCPTAKAAIADWRDRFTIAEGRAVSPGNFHITLAFLGSVEESAVDRLCDRVDTLLSKRPYSASSITFDCVGYWPAPRIYWLGTQTEGADLADWADRLGAVGQEFGARREKRPYVPHVSLFRAITAPPPAPLLTPDFDLSLDEITLFSSRQSRSGVIYDPICSWPAVEKTDWKSPTPD